jgi:hypothetical protein
MHPSSSELASLPPLACVKSSHSFDRYPKATRDGYSASAKQQAVIPAEAQARDGAGGGPGLSCPGSTAARGLGRTSRRAVHVTQEGLMLDGGALARLDVLGKRAREEDKHLLDGATLEVAKRRQLRSGRQDDRPFLARRRRCRRVDARVDHLHVRDEQPGHAVWGVIVRGVTVR